MLLCMYNFVSNRMSRERGRRILNDANYRVHTLPENLMVFITYVLIDRLFQEGNNQPLPSDPVLSHLHHPSTDEPLGSGDS